MKTISTELIEKTYRESYKKINRLKDNKGQIRRNQKFTKLKWESVRQGRVLGLLLFLTGNKKCSEIYMKSLKLGTCQMKQVNLNELMGHICRIKVST